MDDKMIRFCEYLDDHHAPFPHRIITKVAVLPDCSLKSYEFVICALCDHWIPRIVPNCHCSAGCHPNFQYRIADDDETD